MYYQPILFCDSMKSRNYYEWHNIVLPYPELPDWDGTYDEEDEDFPWPDASWHAVIGCQECGLVSEYLSDEVAWGQAPVKGEGRFHSDAAFVRVNFECGQLGCRAPIQFYTATQNRSDESIPLLIRKLQDGFFHGRCPRGHALVPIPKERYRIQRILEAIPTDAGETTKILC